MPHDERIAWLDAGRVLAAGFVVLFHLLYELWPDSGLRPVGFMGASLFFILSGFSLASRYPEAISFRLDWMKKRWLRIAVVYYPALVAVFSLFPTQVTHAGLFALFTHFGFIDFLFPDTAYAIISPAWFLIPLMGLYIVFPFLNRLVKMNGWVVLPAFIAMALLRMSEPYSWTSFSPLFFLGEFCFGIAIVHGSRLPAYASVLVALFPNPLMAIPYVIFFVLSRLRLEALGPVLAPIGRRTLEIFLFHEAFVKAAVGRWSFYGQGVAITLVAVSCAFLLVVAVSSALERRFLKH
ncbi:acyltransferase family protein [Candidatus Micrarchaeota archaeon]|nr:acyltransferase family protein [Candidatus Micrarchaeota archaeon]